MMGESGIGLGSGFSSGPPDDVKARDDVEEGVDLCNDPVHAAVARGARRLLQDQSEPGYWCYEFEADCTIPAEYILLAHFTGDPQFTTGLASDLEARIGQYLRARQLPDGGWPLYIGGDMDISCTVKVYYALKLIGDDCDAPHMSVARTAILARGGALRANVFTRITLALFGQLTWRAVPMVPVELMLLPRWLPVHLDKVAYWSRTVTVPLSILCTLRAQANNPKGIGVQELFVRPPADEKTYFESRSRLGRLFIRLDAIARWLEPWVPLYIRRAALRRAQAWIVERLNGPNGLGAIFPAMVNAYEALGELGYSSTHPDRQTAAEAIKRLVVLHTEEAYCQPCVSPIWDTGLACLALHEVDRSLPGDGPEIRFGGEHESGAGLVPGGGLQRRPEEREPRFTRRFEDTAAVPIDAPRASPEALSLALELQTPASQGEGLDVSGRALAIRTGLDWLVTRQLRNEPGDWRAQRPRLAGGGWPFEFGNPHYPDVDDTAAVGWIMTQFDRKRYAVVIERAAQWVAGMQSRNGGFASFDVDNTHYYLNQVPFADHGALLDPPTSDVTARCVAFLSVVDPLRFASVIERGLNFLTREQEAEGSWFGRWGSNYIYGTWSVLSCLELVGEFGREPAAGALGARLVERGTRWLESCQRSDGGWGESNNSYYERQLMGVGEASTSFHTAWALLGLMAAARTHTPAVESGIAYLRQTQGSDGLWYDDAFSCPGFPRVFYLKYHGYSKYFPLWALARYSRHCLNPSSEIAASGGTSGWVTKRQH